MLAITIGSKSIHCFICKIYINYHFSIIWEGKIINVISMDTVIYCIQGGLTDSQISIIHIIEHIKCCIVYIIPGYIDFITLQHRYAL